MFKWIPLFALLSLQGCTQLLFHPMSNLVITPDSLGVHYDDIQLASADGTRLHGWWLHAQGDSKGTVLFFHGNAENISTHIAHVYWLADYGYDVVSVDYRGYGRSEGEPGIAGSLQDIQASLAYVISARKDSALPLFVIGQSMGGSLAVAALAQTPLKNSLQGVVLIGSFSDYRKITQDVLSTWWLSWALQWPLSFTVDNTYSPKQYIARLSPVPVLIMHGEQDEVVPVAHAGVLYANAEQPKYLQILRGDHNHIMANRQTRDVLLDYLQRFAQKN